MTDEDGNGEGARCPLPNPLTTTHHKETPMNLPPHIASMKVPALYLPAQTAEPIDIFDLKDASTLKPLYNRIGCSLVERVKPQVDFLNKIGPMCLWIDEEGRCKNEPIINLRASIIAGQELYGNAVLCGDNDKGFHITPLHIPNIGRFALLLSLEAISLQKKIDAGVFEPDRL
jgi:hypothetical protein